MADEPNRTKSGGPTQEQLAAAADSVIAQELMQGSHEALSVVIDRYQRLVFTIAFRIVKDVGEAEDLVQVVFLEIFRKAKLFDSSKGTFKVWLLRCAYTRSMDRRDKLEHRRFYSSVELDEAGPLAIQNGQFFESLLTTQEARRFVQQALDTLNPNQRKAVDSIALEGMTLEEAAKFLGYSVPSTRHHYYRGIMALRAFGTSQGLSTAGEPMQNLAVGNGNRGVAHLKPRPV
jgi:RNA polymerase sigma-70 factor (ECF subfamily)